MTFEVSLSDFKVAVKARIEHSQNRLAFYGGEIDRLKGEEPERNETLEQELAFNSSSTYGMFRQATPYELWKQSMSQAVDGRKRHREFIERYEKVLRAIALQEKNLSGKGWAGNPFVRLDFYELDEYKMLEPAD